MDLVFPLIQGNAYAIAKNLMKTETCSWNVFRKQIESLYDPKTRQRELRKQLAELKQRDNYTDFLHTFRNIANFSTLNLNL